MTTGWAVVFALASLANPIAIAAGVATGLVARRWWHLAGAAAIPPLVQRAWGGGTPLLPLAAFLGGAALVWAVAAHAGKRAWRGEGG